jgi:HAD superfamily hydrolase (TIGR01509 family)
VRARDLVIFDAFNTIVTSRRGSKRTFLAGLVQSGLNTSRAMLAKLQVASEGLDHSEWSGSRQAYSEWAAETLASVAQVGLDLRADLASRVVPALEQLHQAPMVALPGAEDCLARLKRAGFSIALCSNWGWDLAADLARTGLADYIDVFVTSARSGYRKPHPRIYQATLELAGFGVKNAVFIGDSLRTDAVGPQRIGIRSVLLASAAKRQIHTEQVASLADAACLLGEGARRQPPCLRSERGLITGERDLRV